MKFVADESVDCAIVIGLRKVGFDVLYITEAHPGMEDSEILEKANAAPAILITADKDFGELVFRLAKIHQGVILYRLAGESNESKANYVIEAIIQYGSQMLEKFTVISKNKIRIRERLRLI